MKTHTNLVSILQLNFSFQPAQIFFFGSQTKSAKWVNPLLVLVSSFVCDFDPKPNATLPESQCHRCFY